MSDNERLEEIKSRVWKEPCTYAVGDDLSREGYRYILADEDYHWLLQQAKQRQKLLERLNKRGIEVKKLKTQLSRCREKIKNSEWNRLVLKGTADHAMRANRSNYELAHKLKEENKRLREALEFYASGNHYSDKLYDYKIILIDDGEKARQALEGTE